MAVVKIFLCFCVCIQLVFGQFGFFPQRGERRLPTFGFGQNFFPNPNDVRNTLTNIFNPQPQKPQHGNQNNQNGHNFLNNPFLSNFYDQNRPNHNNQYDQYRPNHNNQYDQYRPNYNNEYENRPVYNEYDRNGENEQYPNRPINNNYNQNGEFNNNNPTNNEYPYNQPNYVNFPNRGSENTNDRAPSTSNPFVQPEYVEPVDIPKENEYEFQDKEGSADQGSVTDAPNNYDTANKPTFAPINSDAFENKNGIPDSPPQFVTGVVSTTGLPVLTPVPPSAKTDNFNFGSAGLFSNKF